MPQDEALSYCPGCVATVLDQISEHPPRQQINTLLVALASVLHENYTPADAATIALAIGPALGLHMMRARAAASAFAPAQGRA